MELVERKRRCSECGGEEVWKVIFTSGPRWFIFHPVFIINHRFQTRRAPSPCLHGLRGLLENPGVLRCSVFLSYIPYQKCSLLFGFLMLPVATEEDKANVLLSSGPLWFMIIQDVQNHSGHDAKNTIAFGPVATWIWKKTTPQMGKAIATTSVHVGIFFGYRRIAPYNLLSTDRWRSVPVSILIRFDVLRIDRCRSLQVQIIIQIQ